jgi:ribokinase
VIAVVGSVNTDISARVPHLPAEGETVLGHSALRGLGGKGANQAVAARRLLKSGAVRLIACVGNDGFGDDALLSLERHGINLGGIARVAAPTGLALVQVDEVGQNCIAVIPGANALLGANHIADGLRDVPSLVCVSLEIAFETAQSAIRTSRDEGARVVVNASPVRNPADIHILEGAHVIVLNRLEAQHLTETNLGTPLEAARHLREVTRAEAVIVTLGSKGAVWAADVDGMCPAFAVQAVDTTGAGDTFCGALCVALLEDQPFERAVRFASAAAALCAAQPGTSAAMPTRADVDGFMARAEPV